MIDVNDLMLGSYVQVPNGQFGVVETLMKSGVIYASYLDKEKGMTCAHANHFQPIPITPEWLERLGFERKYGTLCRGCFTAYTKATPITINNGCVFEAWLVPGDMFSESRFEVEYIHQLQNLYFATTKWQLTLGGGL